MPSHFLPRCALAIVQVFALASCSTAPGPWLDHDRLSDNLSPPQGQTVYPVQLITAQTVMAQRSERAERLAHRLEQSGVHGTGAKPVSTYHVAPPDVLSITVYGHPELASAAVPTTPTVGAGTSPIPDPGRDTATPQAQTARISPDGTIFFPTLGRVPVSGKTTEDIATQIANALSTRVHKPQVDVSVVRYLSQQIELTGAVRTPGAFPITDASLTLVGALAGAGGTLPDADLSQVRLTRNGQTSVLDIDAVFDRGDATQNIALRGGDILNVPDRGANRIFVIGETLKPSAVPMSKWPLTLADALTTAGSIDPKAADPRQIYVIREARQTPDQPSIYRLDMTQIDSLMLATQFQMRPLDVVYVGTASSVRFNRILDQVLPSLQALFYTVQLGR